MSAPPGHGYTTLLTVSKPEGDITLSLREDSLKLRMSIVRSAKREPLGLRAVLTLLRERHVTLGVKQDAIQQALKNVEAPFSRISDELIAEGQAPVPGEDSHLNSLIAADDHWVEADQPVAECIAPSAGTPGKDVFGQTIAPHKGEAHTLTPGSGVRLEGDRYIATQAGFAAITHDHVAVSDRFDVRIDDDAFVATVSTQGEPFEPTLLLDYLGELGIAHGLLHEELTAIAGRGQAEQRVIAEGNRPEPGQDPKIEFHFVRQNDPRLRDDPKANPFDMFDPGSTVLTLTPARQGVVGLDLFNQEHPVAEVDWLGVVAGDNVETVEQDGQQLFQCTHRGAPFLTQLAAGQLRLDVKDTLDITGDLSAEFSHLRFEGDVFIGGNIPNGHRVTTEANLHVGGVISDAEVHVGGDLHLASGFMGGHGEVAGDLHCKYIDNARLRVRGNLHVANEIIGARIHCDGTIEAPKAVLRGGLVSALRGMTLAEIGSDSRELRTDVHAGVDERLKGLQASIDEQLAVLAEEEEKHNERIHRLLPDRRQIKQLPESLRDEVKRLLQRLSAIGSERETLDTELTEAKTRAAQEADGFILVRRAVHGGTRLCIGLACSDVSRDITGPARLIERDGEIIIERDQ